MRTMTLVLILAAFGTDCLAQRAGSSVAAGEVAGSAAATATRVEEAPVLDGRLDESLWAMAERLTGFTEREPVEGIPAEEDTDVRFIYTEDALYVGARMYGDPAEIRADVTRRDAESDAEQLIVSLDTYRDGRTAYTFVVTASGVRTDFYHPSDYEGARDYSFDPVWEAEAVVDEEGWTAELRIPFTQLRFSPSEEQVWGVNLVRRRPALQKESFWRLVGRDETGWASRMGELRGISGVRPSRRVEVQPYVATSGTLASGTDPENPFEEARQLSMRVGGDAKVGLGPNLTLDATFNPDFGQVEADPAVVNLSAYEVFFEERRPFFTEGAQLFSFGDLFYSRRIGARPQGDPDADHVETLDNTTILGAAKLTGRLPGGLSLGVLGAVTDEESVETFDAGANEFGRATVEPLTAYTAARMEQQFGSSASTVGGMLTAVRRNVDPQSDLAELMNSTALTGGLDGRFRWLGGRYDLNWRVAFSHIRGSEAAIERQQRSSRRYYQRPDADYVQLDPSRTSLSGYSIDVGHSRTGAENWLWDVDVWAESPGYEPNDLGRLGNADGIGGFAGVTYRETMPGRLMRNYAVRLMTTQEWNYGGEHIVAWHGFNLSGQFTNFWSGELGIDHEPALQSPSLTRGGPLMMRPGFRGPFVAIGSPSGRRVQARVALGGGTRTGGGSVVWVNPSISVRPAPQLELSVEPEYRRDRHPRQYVETLGGGRAETFGERYVFSHLDHTEIAARIRIDYAIGPDLTMEGYVEPFASAGEYRRFGELLESRGFDLRSYGTGGTSITREGEDYVVSDGASSFRFEDPSFHVRSFRSNLVLRWEWRPGSTLYLVWQQDRSGSDIPGLRAEPGDLLGSLRADGDNSLAIKATYWLPW
ncbi:MAG: DUF5916 domain-containing protein [Gemmatimonadota bacterium]